MNRITSTFSLLLKKYSPAQKPPGANPKGRRHLTTLYSSAAKTVARYGSIVAGDKRAGLLRTGASGGG